MTFTKLILTASLLFTLPLTALAADPVLDEETDVETLPNKKLERRGERIKGPITSIGAGGMLFASFDKNADYRVTQAEFTSGLSTAFKAADKDVSKTLSLFELEDWREAALGSLDAAPGNLAFDKDYDQRVTRSEFDHALGFVFKAGDKNDDGALDFSELVKVFEMPRRPIIEDEEDPIDRINRQGRRDQQRRRGY
ncbi:EF-hand domain-containing protein [Hellea balneolensis]|uniref:hypothetical protein n=1 Tax=Hellea balneolensis TaxID=287478 RepID=UPI00041C73A3|nr:hypothetical protein [Hellea balneolensis]